MSTLDQLDDGNREILRHLEIGYGWIESGVITISELRSLWRAFESSDDRNTEHVRWRRFQAFLESRGVIEADLARELYALGASDPDPAMGASMMMAILNHPDCPPDLVVAACQSEQKSLREAGERVRDARP